MTPSLGVNADGTTLPTAGDWSASVAFRYYNSRQDVLGDEPQDIPIVYANTHVYGFDLNVTYAVTDRLNLSLDIPFQYGTRSTSVEHGRGPHDPANLHTMTAGGMGDPRLGVNYWLFDPKTYPNRNISIGLGIKIPIGVDDATDYSYRPTGTVLRPVDPAIQPGDGGWGVLFSARAFSSLFFETIPFTSVLKNTTAYFDGTYLANPRETNDTQSVDGDIFLQIGLPRIAYDSVPDQFLLRAGVSQVVWPSKGLSASLGLRWEGTPASDLFGGNDGWRLPGNGLSIDPSISVSYGRNYFSVAVPFTVHRHASRAEPFAAYNFPPGGSAKGLATIADYQIILSYTYQF